MNSFFLLLGLPGSGKGTQSKVLSEALNFSHVSCGDVFREHVVKKTIFGTQAIKRIEKGELVSDEETCTMFFDHLDRLPTNQTYLLEGFPRTLHQAESFDEYLQKSGNSLVKVFYLNVSINTLAIRLSTRLICPTCGAIYNKQTAQPIRVGVCDFDGDPLIQRVDDSSEIIQKRLALYSAIEKPVLHLYEKQSLITRVDGEISIEALTDKLLKLGFKC